MRSAVSANYHIEIMAKYPSDTTPIPEVLVVDSLGDEKKAAGAEHLETTVGGDTDGTGGLHKKAAIAIIKQQHTIPATGKRVPTSKLEYVLFCIFCKYSIDVDN
jgi:hypothetical protein